MCSVSHGDGGNSNPLITEFTEADLHQDVSAPLIWGQKIELMEAPQEEITFDLFLVASDVQKDLHHVGYSYLYIYNLCFEFHNDLHNISNFLKDYYYEIKCRALIESKDGTLQHLFLFSHEFNRTSDLVQFSDQHVHLTEDFFQSLKHFCFTLRRFCVNKMPSICCHFKSICESLRNQGFDVTLIVGKKSFTAHKCILSLKSEVFKVMFTHDMLENQSGVVEIEGFEPNVVEAMLNFVYGYEIQEFPVLLKDLLVIADKYVIGDLVRKCEEHLIFSINNQTVFDILKQSHYYNLKNVYKTALVFMCDIAKNIVIEGDFVAFLCQNLEVETVAHTLRLSDKYNLEVLMLAAFEFAKDNIKAILHDVEFSELFNSHPDLMRDLFKHAIQ